MKLIAHRGQFEGPDISLENKPGQIELAISYGYDCEIDLTIIDNVLYLGHDSPEYPISPDFLEQYKNNLWIHAKNLDGLYWLSRTEYNYFWHQNDDYVITSHKYIWTYPGKELRSNSIMVMPEWISLDIDIMSLPCYGLCSDYVSKFK